MDNAKIKAEFPVTIYGDLSKYNDVTSHARCRIFYKYENRNGTYITDEFAEKLISSLPYTPVKGIYEDEDKDYTDHGEKRSLGRIYGIVPENNNFAWETFLDEDGVERTYACTDVLLFTALYQEASDIVGKSQSMEIYDKSIDGDWQYINGRKFFVFTEGCFLGLQVLGEYVEPCFEGASFFTKTDSIDELIEKINQYNLNLQNSQGGKAMPTVNFKISDDQKYNMLWNLLNPDYGEANDWTINYGICDVYDEYAVVRNYRESRFERVYYTKNDETDSLTLGKSEICYIIDVTEAEKNALIALKTLNQGTYEKVDEVYSSIDQLKAEKEEDERKIEEYSASISTLTTERDDLSAKCQEAGNLLDEAKNSLQELSDKYELLSNEKDELVTYKEGIEKAEKIKVIDSYANLLSEELLNTYREKVDEYELTQLDMTLAYELKNSNPSVFTKERESNPLIPKDDAPKGGIEGILDRYKK